MGQVFMYSRKSRTAGELYRIEEKHSPGAFFVIQKNAGFEIRKTKKNRKETIKNT